MPTPFSTILPPDAFKILLVFFLSFLIGLEREEKKSVKGHYAFGGVRTYPLIGLIGYGMAYLSAGQLLPLSTGFAVIGGLMLISYWYKVSAAQGKGLTSEMAGLATYLIGAMVYYGHFWVATAFSVISLILLELKSTLEGLTQHFLPDDILTFTQFLFLTIVILPILPDQNFSLFQINPFRTWLVVVAVSTISYGSFLLQRRFQGQGGVALAAILGGAYSSTATTIALAKKSTTDQRPQTYAGSILMASGVMYLRLGLLMGLFNPGLRQQLLWPLVVLGILGAVGGWLWSTKGRSVPPGLENRKIIPNQNPLELRAALLFALLFVGIIIVTHYTVTNLGDRGVFALAGIMGVTDVDPFILGITQSAGNTTTLTIASGAILIAAASNNLMKGLYALGFGDRKTGLQSLGLLIALAILGLLPLVWLLT